MKAFLNADPAAPILSARWMLHILDIHAPNGHAPRLLRRGVDPSAKELDLAEKCRSYAEAVIIDLAARRLRNHENGNVQATIAKVCQAVLNVHQPDVENWKMFQDQLKVRRVNVGAFARSALMTLELDALANLVEWAAVLTACTLSIGRGNYQSASELSRPDFKPNMRTFSGRVVEWRHCVYAAYALASFWSDLSTDNEWILGDHSIADDARSWYFALRESACRDDLSPRHLLDQIVSKRASILPREEIQEKLALLNRDTNNVDELLELDAARVSRELRTILKNAHVLRCSDHSGEES